MATTSEMILLVEDSEDDIVLVRRAFKKCRIANPVHVVTNGESAIEYLAGQSHYADRTHHPLPLLILLDLKLPKKSGLEVLGWIRQQNVLKRIPVVILTSSAQATDVNQAYELGANSYLVKPVQFDHLQRLIERLDIYWLRTNVAPDVANT